MELYPYASVEKKWKKRWKEHPVNALEVPRPAFYRELFGDTPDLSAYAGERKDIGPRPDPYVIDYGEDALRLYRAFTGKMRPGEEEDGRELDAMAHFLNRLWHVVREAVPSPEAIAAARDPAGDIADATPRSTAASDDADARYIQQILRDYERRRFHGVAASLMKWEKELKKREDRRSLRTLILLLSPLAPHFAEETWEMLGGTDSIFREKWPEEQPEEQRDRHSDQQSDQK